jgi:hypothetical protein
MISFTDENINKEVRKIELVQAYNSLYSEYIDAANLDENRQSELLSKMSEIDTELFNKYGFEMF